MGDEIEMTETKPGLWEFVRNGFRRSVPATSSDKEAREEAFFNSLGTVKKTFSKPANYCLFWTFVGSFSAIASALLIYNGTPELIFPITLVVGLIPGMMLIIELCHGASWPEAARATVRPHSD